MTSTTEEGISLRLAGHAAALQYGQLPPELIDLTKQCVLDTLAVAIGASTLAPEGEMVAEMVNELDGTPESTVWGFGTKAPAAWAAFVNGGLGHMLDYDDVGGGGHVSIATVPVAFAMAEKLGGVSGKDLITSIAAGADVMTRIGRSVPISNWTMSEGWFSTQLFGFIAGAATAGRLMGLGHEQMSNALGIAFNQSCGSRQMAVGAATHMRSMQAGFSGQGAVLSAELARLGTTGPKKILEGRYGMFRTYIRAENPRWEDLEAGIGETFPLLETHAFKVWPSCAYTRPTNRSILSLRKEHSISPEDVQEIAIVGGSSATRLLSEPIESKRRPQSSIDAKYSIPFTSAIAMQHGRVSLQAYTPEGLSDLAVHGMADRIVYRTDEGNSDAAPLVEVVMRDGRRFSHRSNNRDREPVDWAFLEGKFRDCVSFSKTPITPANVDRAIEMVSDLENLADATAIVRVLHGA
jgi:2-methylcitrate dehydratase PrpD